MQEYFGTKRLKATAMTLGEYNAYRGWDLPADEDGSKEGYLVEYSYDEETVPNHENHIGYISWSPAHVFNEAYQPNGKMSFGHAVEAMKAGHKVARSGWNGAGMFAYLVPANEYPAQTGVAKSHFGEGALVPYRAYMALKTAQEDVATWAPSGSDALAEDWMIVE